MFSRTTVLWWDNVCLKSSLHLIISINIFILGRVCINWFILGRVWWNLDGVIRLRSWDRSWDRSWWSWHSSSISWHLLLCNCSENFKHLLQFWYLWNWNGLFQLDFFELSSNAVYHISLRCLGLVDHHLVLIVICLSCLLDSRYLEWNDRFCEERLSASWEIISREELSVTSLGWIKFTLKKFDAWMKRSFSPDNTLFDELSAMRLKLKWLVCSQVLKHCHLLRSEIIRWHMLSFTERRERLIHLEIN